MKNNIFKVLTYMERFVNENLLEKGIYATDVPHLHNEKTTMEDIVICAKQMQNMQTIVFISDEYFKNLQQCKLIEYKLTKS